MLSFALSTALSVTNLPAFQPCQLDNHFEQLKDSKCIYAKLPLNYTKENTQSIDVFVRKFPTKLEATGSLWLLAGGPGESGAAFYQDIDSLRVAFPLLDIYVQDHRGTGASSKLCKEENIESEQGINLAENEWGPCFGQIYQAPDYVKSFSISNAAQDLTKLINHYKKGDTYIYGVSYGTQLALRVLSQNKVELNGVVLDSLVPHQLNKDYDLSNRSVVVNNIGIEALKRISDNPDDTIAKI